MIRTKNVYVGKQKATLDGGDNSQYKQNAFYITEK